MIPGTIVSMGGQEWTVPPLSLAQLRAVMPRVQQLAGLDANQMGDAQLQALVEIVTSALQRNYPEITTAKVEDIVDLGNALPVLNAILGGIKLPAAEPKPIRVEFETDAPEGQPAAAPAPPIAAPTPHETTNPVHWPWRPNPPVVGS
jgi:hypothetical protein